MSNFLSRAELEEISEGLIRVYATKHRNKVVQSIDIEHFITDFLKLKIEYTSFAESDSGKIGFLADGQTPLFGLATLFWTKLLRTRNYFNYSSYPADFKVFNPLYSTGVR